MFGKTVRHIMEMLEPVQNQTHLIELLERLCLAVEHLNEDLRPELKKTATLERRKQEVKEIETAAAKAVAKWKDKKRNPASTI
jgi:hypothetical protein